MEHDALQGSLQIRKMEQQDLDEVMEIESVSFVSPWTEEMFEDVLDSSLYEAYAFAAGRRVFGYIVFYTVQDEAHIMNIAIAAKERRKGLGSMLLTGITSFLKERGVCQMYLEVREGNEPAKGLYRKLGFGTIGRRKRYYTETNEDALVMWRSIC